MLLLTDGNRQSVSSIDAVDGPQVSPLLPPKPPPVLYIVEAQFDCKLDNKDELAFQEGDKIAVIKVHSNDWLVRIVGNVHYLELSMNVTIDTEEVGSNLSATKSTKLYYHVKA